MNMKKLLLSFILVGIFLLPLPARAQTSVGSLTASTASSCPTNIQSNTSCVVLAINNQTSTVLISISNTYVGTPVFEFSPDNGSSWKTLHTIDVVNQVDATQTTTTGVFAAPVFNYTHVAVRVSAYTSGTVDVIIRGSNSSSSSASSFNIPTTAAGTAATSAVPVQGVSNGYPVPTNRTQTNGQPVNPSITADGDPDDPGSQVLELYGIGVPKSGGAVVVPGDDTYGLFTQQKTILKRYISIGMTEDEFDVKATPGVLVGFSGYNSHATTDAYLKCVNKTAANSTPGTDTVFYSALIPAGPSGSVDSQVNASFSVALSCYIVTGKADSDTTEVAADDVMVNIRYR